MARIFLEIQSNHILLYLFSQRNKSFISPAIRKAIGPPENHYSNTIHLCSIVILNLHQIFRYFPTTAATHFKFPYYGHLPALHPHSMKSYIPSELYTFEFPLGHYYSAVMLSWRIAALHPRIFGLKHHIKHPLINKK